MVRALTQSEEDLFFSFYRGGAFNRVYRNEILIVMNEKKFLKRLHAFSWSI